jgi:hypothetical protein
MNVNRRLEIGRVVAAPGSFKKAFQAQLYIHQSYRMVDELEKRGVPISRWREATASKSEICLF